MLFNTKFDLVIGLGEDCACSSYLRRFVLQEYSFPFDWLAKSDFKSRMELILNNFKDFLNKEDLYEIKKPETEKTDKVCAYYADKRYDFNYFHDFKSSLTFDEAYKEVKDKYARRIERMYKLIDSAEKVLFVWRMRSKDIHQEEKTLLEYYEKLENKFGKGKIYLLLMEYGEKEEYNYLKDNYILTVKGDFVSFSGSSLKAEVMGNIKNNNKIFSQIYKKHSMSWIIKYIIFKVNKFLIGLIPVKNIRQKMREDLKFKFDRAAL